MPLDHGKTIVIIAVPSPRSPLLLAGCGIMLMIDEQRNPATPHGMRSVLFVMMLKIPQPTPC